MCDLDEGHPTLTINNNDNSILKGKREVASNKTHSSITTYSVQILLYAMCVCLGRDY